MREPRSGSLLPAAVVAAVIGAGVAAGVASLTTAPIVVVVDPSGDAPATDPAGAVDRSDVEPATMNTATAPTSSMPPPTTTVVETTTAPPTTEPSPDTTSVPAPDPDTPARPQEPEPITPVAPLEPPDLGVIFGPPSGSYPDPDDTDPAPDDAR